MSINISIVKSQYSMHRIEEILDILNKLKFTTYFLNDAFDSYYVILIRNRDIHKIEIVTSHE